MFYHIIALRKAPLISTVQVSHVFLAATKQLYDWFSPSVCLSVIITMVRSDVHAKGQGQRSKVKVTEVNTQLSCFRTLTPV